MRSSAWSGARATRRCATVERLIPGVELLEGDLTDLPSLIGAMEIAQPDEVYNLGAISFVGLSWRAGGADRRDHRHGRAAHPRGDPHLHARTT